MVFFMFCTNPPLGVPPSKVTQEGGTRPSKSFFHSYDFYSTLMIFIPHTFSDWHMTLWEPFKKKRGLSPVLALLLWEGIYVNSCCTKVIKDVLKYNFEIFPSWMIQKIFQMQWKASCSIDSIRLVCLIFNHEKYHFLLELLSYGFLSSSF